ncbi:MFS transporter [Nocardia neocaledoniensis]|uniref:MFS transporter n=1 Tax=Nocardia neocaledoniensis TaxID=236511 RepID=UPI002458063F|nr:MFS transporter [Nocardia neocaledoniensis]
MRHWVSAHIVSDFYQGMVPASIPFFVLERDYSYVAASGLAVAATLGSSLPQPVLGILVDRWRLLWLAPPGLVGAGAGAGLAGLAPSYPLVWVLLLISGVGVAAFHPAAGRDARHAAGDSTAAMSLFAVGGSIGFFLAPTLVTPTLVSLGMGGTAIFIPPAVLMAFALWRHQQRHSSDTIDVDGAGGHDRWPPFLLLTAVEVIRSVVFIGINTFIAIYWIAHLGATRLLGGLALTAFLVGGVLGTLAGGRAADRIGMLKTIRIGCAAAIPALIALRLVPDTQLGLAAAVVAGVAVNAPFAVLVKLGQDYLPARPGTAAGVTLGLAVSAGGMFLPALGALADRHGPQAVMTALCVIPVGALALAMFLPQPERSLSNPPLRTESNPIRPATP